MPDEHGELTPEELMLRYGEALTKIDPEDLVRLAVVRKTMADHNCDAITAMGVFDDPPETIVAAFIRANDALQEWATTSTRKLGGELVGGDADPHSVGTLIIDTRRSVLVDHIDVAMLDNPSDKRRLAALQLDGKINQRAQRARVLYLLDADGAAGIASQLHGLAQREESGWGDEYRRRFTARMGELPERES